MILLQMIEMLPDSASYLKVRIPKVNSTVGKRWNLVRETVEISAGKEEYDRRNSKKRPEIPEKEHDEKA